MRINFLAEQVNIETALQFARPVKRAFKIALKAMRQPACNIEVNVIFVSQNEMREINKEKRGINEVTDVLSFPLIDIGNSIHSVKVCPKNFKNQYDIATHSLCLGDILICLARAEEQAEAFGHSVLREVAFLAVHGLLHLYGYDHLEPESEKVMVALQEFILNKVKIKRGR